MRDPTLEFHRLAHRRWPFRLHAPELAKSARTIPANGEAHIPSMAQVEPRRSLYTNEKSRA
jgi:hypothetical protein